MPFDLYFTVRYLLYSIKLTGQSTLPCTFYQFLKITAADTNREPPPDSVSLFVFQIQTDERSCHLLLISTQICQHFHILPVFCTYVLFAFV